jgi:glyoxylase-like metal-dependent hydrolase (beta-lactamase superfamily II)
MTRMRPCVEPFFDPATSTFSYVVYEADGGDCAVIDAVLDYDLRSGRTSTGGAERIIDFVRARGLSVACPCPRRPPVGRCLVA